MTGWKDEATPLARSRALVAAFKAVRAQLKDEGWGWEPAKTEAALRVGSTTGQISAAYQHVKGAVLYPYLITPDLGAYTAARLMRLEQARLQIEKRAAELRAEYQREQAGRLTRGDGLTDNVKHRNTVGWGERRRGAGKNVDTIWALELQELRRCLLAIDGAGGIEVIAKRWSSEALGRTIQQADALFQELGDILNALLELQHDRILEEKAGQVQHDDRAGAAAL